MNSDSSPSEDQPQLFSALITGVNAPRIPVLDGRLLIDRRDVAKMLGCEPIDVWQLARSKTIPFVIQGKRKRYLVADILDYVARGNPREN